MLLLETGLRENAFWLGAALFWLYAEIHYHFKIAPSRLYHRQPEIIADAPRRLDPRQPLPLLVLIKDAHLFPIDLLTIEAEITPQRKFRYEIFHAEERIDTQWWWRIFYINLPEELHGFINVNVVIDYRCRGKRLRCCNDNYRTTSHAPFEVFLATERLPTLPNSYHGDLHCHTSATSDQVEFGAPLPAMLSLARAQGLSFFAATDHSYDLDDYADDYLHNDPALRKWYALQAEVHELNRRHDDFVIIPGEEVSCGNANGENVHFLVLQHPHFILGRGDGGEKWLHNRPDHTIAEVLAQLGAEALALAAHPSARVPKLESLLLRRGHWSMNDFAHARLNGLQFWNGKALGEEEGLQQWRKLLLEGRKLFAFAGNDAHGNFNRYRQVAWPCWSMAENHDHIFGHRRTSVYVRGAFHLESLTAALRAGQACITTGPAIALQINCANGEVIQMGGSTNGRATHARVAARSTAEFGKLERVVLWRGDLANKREEKLFECLQFPHAYEFHLELPLPQGEEQYYLRAEVVANNSEESMASAQVARGLSNPVWLLPK